MKDYSKLTDMQLSVQLQGIIAEAIKRDLVKQTYHQNANSLARHVDRTATDAVKVAAGGMPTAYKPRKKTETAEGAR